MINLDNVRLQFNNFLRQYDNKSEPGFKLKVTHTLNVVNNSRLLATNMNLSEEDIDLAQLIAYLHDIGRFEELVKFKGFESVKNDHALYASKILFEGNLIREFINDNQYDNIIMKAIENHNKLSIESKLNDRELLHAKILRDSDKLDNFRVKIEEPIESLFPGKINKIEELNNSLISDRVYNSIINNECVNIQDRVYPLDYLICILGFIFDINFKETFTIIKEKNYTDKLIDRFNYTNIETVRKIESIRTIIKDYIVKRIKGENYE